MRLRDRQVLASHVGAGWVALRRNGRERLRLVERTVAVLAEDHLGAVFAEGDDGVATQELLGNA
jgi:hypothetical protein